MKTVQILEPKRQFIKDYVHSISSYHKLWEILTGPVSYLQLTGWKERNGPPSYKILQKTYFLSFSAFVKISINNKHTANRI